MSDWAWRRFTVHTGKNSFEAGVPPYLVMFDNIHFPWAYDNMIVLKRRKTGLCDLWVRLPSANSKRPEQLKNFVLKLQGTLDARFPNWNGQVEAPWEEGPPLYPVFEPETLKKFGKPSMSNVFFEGAEFLGRQDWAGRFQQQTATMMRLQTLRQQELARKAKKEKKVDTAIHAP